MSGIKLVVGLGNPGIKYELTRHNIGWLVIDQLSFFNQLNWQEKFKGEYAKNGDVFFLKPQTFMNLSGESVQPLMHFFKIQPSELLVLHDEIDLPYGQIGFKQGGGLAGHNGLKSIAEQLGTKDFKRLRIGVSRPEYGEVSSWVLGKFGPDEEAFLDQFLKGSAEALEHCLKSGFQKAAGKYSKKNFLNQD